MVELKLFHKFLIFIAVIISLLRLSRKDEKKIKNIVVRPTPSRVQTVNTVAPQRAVMQPTITVATQSHKLVAGSYPSRTSVISIPDADISERIPDAPDRLLFIRN
jgi:hypothetical protein